MTPADKNPEATHLIRALQLRPHGGDLADLILSINFNPKEFLFFFASFFSSSLFLLFIYY